MVLQEPFLRRKDTVELDLVMMDLFKTCVGLLKAFFVVKFTKTLSFKPRA